jgi:predicted GNAT family acetyltransferase
LANNPRVWTEVGTGRVVRWVGLRAQDGSLLAVGGAELEASGVPHLAGIVTALDQRGQGLGTVVSAALTRWAVAQHGVCTLGMFSDNEPARRLYGRLGYRTARSWHSRTLVPRS